MLAFYVKVDMEMEKTILKVQVANIIIIIIIPYFHRVIQSAINIAAIKRSPV